MKQLRFGPRERFQIPTPDGFLLEAELILPPDLDTGKKYPVWFMTYGGPHAPTVSDSWGGGRMWDQALAHEGFVVFRMDPRSASGKGALATWKAYKHLGVQELEDIKTAINWLKQKPYVDGSRIGMAGHSYGGYITSYAHDPLRPLRRGHRRGAGHRLARLRLDLHRALHGAAAGQPRGLQRLVGGQGGGPAARQAVDRSMA